MSQEIDITKCSAERLDHLGIVAGVIKDLKIVELIDARLGTYEDEHLTAGETVAGMIINGLGFSGKAMYLTPLFFKDRPLSILFRKGVKAEHFNRFKLGRILDRCHDYGTELLFSEISLSVCRQEKVDTRFNNLDTTNFSLHGDYQPRGDEDEVVITHGHSKAHRPDLKQVVLEMMVSRDGGIPLMGKCLDGNASDNTVFKERTEKLVEEFKQSETPRYLIADCKLYTSKNAKNLKDLPFITRIPNTIALVGETIDKALDAPKEWTTLKDGRQMQTFDVEHYGIQQRWHVLSSETSRQKAEKQVNKRIFREEKAIDAQLFHLQAKRFKCADDALLEAQTLAKKWKNHTLKTERKMIEHHHYKTKGRPKKGQKPDKTDYQIIAKSQQDAEKIESLKKKKGHYIIGGNTDPECLGDEEVVIGYQEQNKVEQGFRFLKDPLFFVSSLFVKTPKRIMALLMVMLLSLLVYGVAERRMRAYLENEGKTLPNQLGKSIKTPTLRWVFQLMSGINYLKVFVKGQMQGVINGITALQRKIVSLFGKTVENMYYFSSG